MNCILSVCSMDLRHFNTIHVTKIVHPGFVSECFRDVTHTPTSLLAYLWSFASSDPPVFTFSYLSIITCTAFILPLPVLVQYSCPIALPQPAASISTSVNDIVLFPESLSPRYWNLNMSCGCRALWFIESSVSGEIGISASFTMDFSVGGCWTLLHRGESTKKTLLFDSGGLTPKTMLEVNVAQSWRILNINISTGNIVMWCLSSTFIQFLLNLNYKLMFECKNRP